jgi:hypothetical protein
MTLVLPTQPPPPAVNGGGAPGPKPRKNPLRQDVAQYLRQHHHSPADAVNTRALCAQFDADFSSFSAAVSGWFAQAKGGWEHVHRREIRTHAGPRAFLYWYDQSKAPRKPGGLTKRGKAAFRPPAPEEPTEAPAVTPQMAKDQLVAVVLWDHDDEVVLMDANGALIQGRRLR